MSSHRKHSRASRRSCDCPDDERKKRPTFPTVETPPRAFGTGKSRNSHAIVLKGFPSTLRGDLNIDRLDLHDRLNTNGFRVIVDGTLTFHEGGLLDNSGRSGSDPNFPGAPGGVGTLGRLPANISGTFTQAGGSPDGNGGNTFYVAVSQATGGFAGGHSNSNAASGNPLDFYNQSTPPFLTFGDIFNASDSRTQFTGGAGGSGSPTSFGGGGAGVMVVIARNIVVKTFQSTLIQAAGGNGAFSSGGGGGGLVVLLFERSSGFRAAHISVAGGISGGQGAQQGEAGASFIRQRKTSSCCCD